MESVLGRYRNLIILVGVLFLQVLGLATQVKRGNDQQHTRLIRIWIVGAIAPFERGLVWIENGTSNIWHNYFYLRGVRAENRELKQQVEQMRIEQVRLSEDAAQAHRLQNLLAFKEQYISKTLAAQVIGTSGTDSNRVVYIDKGSNDGVARDMAVITADGIVGKVSLVYASEAQVLLINDQMSGVGVILGDTRLQGWLGGTANGDVMLNAVMSDEQVPIGEKVLTSGGDRIFPKGLPVGTVAKVSPGKDLFLSIKVKPAANLSKLEEVLVLVEKQERLATADDNVRVRAADILAARLPSVPDKPADANTAPSAAAEGSTKPATNTAAKPATEGSSPANPRSSNTPVGGAASAKPTGNAAAKPVSTGAGARISGTAASGTSGAASAQPGAPAVKKPSGSGAGKSAPGQTAKLTNAGSTPSNKAVSDANGTKSAGSKLGSLTGTSTEPATVAAKPAESQPKPVKPATPPSNQQPVDDQNNPH